MKRLILIVLFALASVSLDAAQLPNNIAFFCPTSPDNVPAGQTFTLRGTVTKDCIQVSGTLQFADNLQLRATTIEVLPGGRLETESKPGRGIRWKVRDVPPTDMDQWSTGLVVFGSIGLEGETTATRVRLTADALAGATTVQVSSTAGMSVGGEVVFGDERHLWSGADENAPRITQLVTIASLTPTSITFSPALTIAHRGARNADGTVSRYPYVGYVTRSIVIESENPNGTRGHTVFTGAGSGRVSGTAFVNLGRTPNDVSSTAQAGRYATHLHMGTGHIEFVGNVVRGSPKWGISVHQTNGNLIDDNIFIDNAGWGLGTEMTTADNIFSRNLVINTRGDGNRGDRCRNFDSPPICRGTAGVGIWGDTTNDAWRDNAVVGSLISCFMYFSNRTTPIKEFSSGECWGSRGGEIGWDTGPGVFNNFFAANVWLGTYNYAQKDVVYRNWVCRGDPQNIPPSQDYSTCFDYGDYSQMGIVVENADVQNMRIGMRWPWAIADPFPGTETTPREHIVRDSSFCNNGTDLAYMQAGNTSTGVTIPPITVRSQRNLHCAQSAVHEAYTGPLLPTSGPVHVYVEDYQRVATDDLEVFNTATAPASATARAKFSDKVLGGTPPPPTDSDGDGVIDANDKCPGTAPGTPVDAAGCPVPPPQGATITVNPAQTFQTIRGWENATLASIQDWSGLTDAQLGQLYDVAIAAGFTRARLAIRSGSEGTSSSSYVIVNDNADPNVLDATKFFWTNFDVQIERQIIPLRQRAAAKGVKFYVNLNYVDFGSSPFEHYTDPREYGEFMYAVFAHMQTKYGFVPDAIEPMLEPNDVAGWTPTNLGQGIVAAAAALQAHGFAVPEFIAPSTSNLDSAPGWLDGILAVPGAKALVKEFSYHRYGGANTANLVAIGAKGVPSSMLEKWPDANYDMLYQDLSLANVTAWQLSAYAEPTCQNGVATAFVNGVASLCPNAKIVRQYTQFVMPGSRRIGATSTNPVFLPLVFIRADGGYVVTVKAEGGAGPLTVGGLPAGTYGAEWTSRGGTQATTKLPDVTITAGQALASQIDAEGVLTIYAKGGGPPPPVDTDGDGVPDATDKCPTQPGPASNAGCPIPPPTDTDGDGVPNSIDKCPLTPAGVPVDAAGCPIGPPPVDTDNDGVPDTLDKCPTQPGPASNGGCPLPPPTQETTVTDIPRTCTVTLEAAPPAGFTSPTARIRNMDTGQNIGTSDSAAPYMPSANITVGSYSLAIRWTQSGMTAVTYPAKSVKCGG